LLAGRFWFCASFVSRPTARSRQKTGKEASQQRDSTVHSQAVEPGGVEEARAALQEVVRAQRDALVRWGRGAGGCGTGGELWAQDGAELVQLRVRPLAAALSAQEVEALLAERQAVRDGVLELEVGLAVQVGGLGVRGTVRLARPQHDEVAGHVLSLPHQHHVACTQLLRARLPQLRASLRHHQVFKVVPVPVAPVPL
jgi:hypothetical protein